MNDSESYVGVKIALFYKGKLLVYQRDSKPGLRFSGLWDFFGGGKEGDETPCECITRELSEELVIRIKPRQIIFTKAFPAMHDPAQIAYFMVANLTNDNVSRMKFGSEGQAYRFISVDEFLESREFVPALKPRLESYLQKARNQQGSLLQNLFE